jgi:hypothetical protein
MLSGVTRVRGDARLHWVLVARGNVVDAIR